LTGLTSLSSNMVFTIVAHVQGMAAFKMGQTVDDTNLVVDTSPFPGLSSAPQPASSTFVLPERLHNRQHRKKAMFRVARGIATMLTAIAFNHVYGGCSAQRRLLQSRKDEVLQKAAGCANHVENASSDGAGEWSGAHHDTSQESAGGRVSEMQSPAIQPCTVAAIRANADKVILAAGAICVAVL
jgi:hypothetical protein